MTKKVYVRKKPENQAVEKRGFFWIIATMMLILLMVPILWMHYPFRVPKGGEKGGLQESKRVLITAKIPRPQEITNQVPAKAEEAVKGEKEPVTKENVSSGGGGGVSQPAEHHEEPQPTTKPPNPYELAAKAEKEREAHEEEAKKAVSQEGIKDMDVLAKVQSPELEKIRPEDSHDLYEMVKAKTTQTNTAGGPSTTTGSPSEAVGSAAAKSEQQLSGSGPAYFIQAGAFSQESNASDLKARLQKMGYQVVIHKVHHVRLGQLYLVRIPFEGSYEEARKEQQKIQKLVGEKPVIVRLR